MHISDGVFIMSIGSEARFLAVDDAEKKKTEEEEKGRGSRRDTMYRRVAVRGCRN